MTKYRIHDKEKHNSIELTLLVPIMPMPKTMEKLGSWTENQETALKGV